MTNNTCSDESTVMLFPLGPPRTEGLSPSIVGAFCERVFRVCGACPDKEASDALVARTLTFARDYAVWALPRQYVEVWMREMVRVACAAREGQGTA